MHHRLRLLRLWPPSQSAAGVVAAPAFSAAAPAFDRSALPSGPKSAAGSVPQLLLLGIGRRLRRWRPWRRVRFLRSRVRLLRLWPARVAVRATTSHVGASATVAVPPCAWALSRQLPLCIRWRLRRRRPRCRIWTVWSGQRLLRLRLTPMDERATIAGATGQRAPVTFSTTTRFQAAASLAPSGPWNRAHVQSRA